MPAPVAESMIRKMPKVQAAPEVANKPPQPPVSPENGEQFARPSAEQAGISRVEAAADERISRHAGLATGELIAPQSDDGAGEQDELVTRAMRQGMRGRPAAFDERSKGQLIALLALGLSL